MPLGINILVDICYFQHPACR